MKQESPIEEIWRIRDQLGAEENYDVHRLFERLRREQQAFAGRLVQPPPRGMPSKPASALREEPPPYAVPPTRKAPEGHRSQKKHENPIEEIWRIRDQIAAECGYDVSRLFKRLREEEAKYKDRLVSFAPRKTAKPARKQRRAPAK